MAKPFGEGKFNITKNEEVYNGPHSKIDAVTLSSGEHSLKLLQKKVHGYSIEFMQGPGWHTRLKEKGYPVFPTYRYDSANEVEYVTDLRREGTHRVIDFCGGKENYEKAYISNIEEVKADIRKLLDKSADDGLVINEPNIFFDVEISTGIAKVLLGDLRELGYESDDPRYDPTREEIFANNEAVLSGHLNRLLAIMKQDSKPQQDTSLL